MRHFEVTLPRYKSGDECHIIVDSPDEEHIKKHFPHCLIKEMDHDPMPVEVDLTLHD